MVEIIPDPVFTDLFNNQFGIAAMGVIIIGLVALIITVIKDGLLGALVCFLLIACFGLLPLLLVYRHLEKQAYNETLNSIEETYGVKFSSQQREFEPASANYRSLIVPRNDDFIIVPNVRITGTEEIYEVMVAREDDMLTLLVPKVEGSKEYVKLEVVE